MRLIDADNLNIKEEYFGTDEFIYDEISKCSEEIVIDYEDELRNLCDRIIDGFLNIIETEPTAYDVDKVVEQLKDVKSYSVSPQFNKGIDRAIEIVQKGGEEMQYE